MREIGMHRGSECSNSRSDDLNSPKRAKRNFSLGRVASFLNFSHSFAGRTLSQFCAFLFPFSFLFFFLRLFLATPLPPTRFRTSSWKLMFHRLCGHCLRSSRWSSCAFNDSVFFVPIFFAESSGLLVAPRRTSIFFRFSRLPENRVIVMTLL